MENNYKPNELVCSFCGKTSSQVRRIIVGQDVNICNECIELCSELLKEDGITGEAHETLTSLPTPKEIAAELGEYVIEQDEAKKTVNTSYPGVSRNPCHPDGFRSLEEGRLLPLAQALRRDHHRGHRGAARANQTAKAWLWASDSFQQRKSGMYDMKKKVARVKAMYSI